MRSAIQSHGMYVQSPTNEGLWNFLSGIKATPAQEHDLLKIREISQSAYDLYIQCWILKHPTTTAPKRKKKLCTFSVTKSQKRRSSQIERERKLAQRYLKRQLTWLTKHGISGTSHEMLYGQISPRGLVYDNGLPFKSSKSSTTTFLQKRYNSTMPIMDTLPQCIPQSVILEGMFMIQTPAIATMSTMQDYVKLLLNRYVKPHLIAGAIEVHVVFDHPGGLPETPKEIEHRRRYKEVDQQHNCLSFSNTSPIPIKWRTVIECRYCKRALTTYISSEMLSTGTTYLTPDQTLITNIGERAYSVTGRGTPQPEPILRCNSEEADLRVWLHCKHSAGDTKLIFSPDTDTYHIGLPLCKNLPSIDVYIQLGKSTTESPKFMHMNALLDALINDPDLAPVKSELRPQLMQSIYVCTGCDYISFFKGIRKVTFLKTLLQYASFIAGDADLLGSIADPDSDNSLFSFLRLVGCAYFSKHKSGFQASTPRALFNSVHMSSPQEQHFEWLSQIRAVVWERADTENDMLPTTEALKLHWKRCIWVLKMYRSAQENEISLPGKVQYYTYIHVQCTITQSNLSFHKQIFVHMVGGRTAMESSKLSGSPTATFKTCISELRE